MQLLAVKLDGFIVVANHQSHVDYGLFHLRTYPFVLQYFELYIRRLLAFCAAGHPGWDRAG
jgi:hypothetical protein